MRRCFELAQKGSVYAHPNPLVGSVVVFDNKIIGEGYHRAIGEAHAEVNAILSVQNKELLPKSTLYVNLEPCCHYGKTPPCSELIITSGIKKVVVCNKDPFDKVAGNGIAHLRQNGVEVIENILLEEGLDLNRRFFRFHTTKKPFIILKWAETADGFMGRNNEEARLSKKISNPLSQRLVHKLRAESDAILVGKNTAIFDNPELTTRYFNGRNPVRITIDLHGEIPENHHFFDGNSATVVFGKKRNLNAEFVEVSDTENTLKQLFEYCYKNNLSQLLVEGGAVTLGHFIHQNEWNEAIIIKSDICWQKGVASPPFNHQKPQKSFQLANDLIQFYRNH